MKYIQQEKGFKRLEVLTITKEMKGVLSYTDYRMLGYLLPSILLWVTVSISLAIISSLIYYTIIKRLCKCCFTRSCIKFFKKCPKCTIIRNGVKDVIIRVSNFLLFEFVEQEGNKECEDENEEDGHLEESSASEDTDPENENGSHDEPVDNENGSHDKPVDDETNDQQENQLTLVHEYQEYTQIELGTSMGRKKEKKQLLYYLYGVQVHYRLIQFLFVVSLSIIGMGFVLFWNTFMVQYTAGCDSRYDCFVTKTNNKNSTLYEPITNCTDFKNDNNSDARCYRLVFNFSEGIGAAGGFLFAMRVLVNLLVYVTIRVRKMKCNNACCRITVKFAVLITIFTLQLAVTLVAPIVFVAKLVTIVSEEAPQYVYQFAVYIYMSLFLLFVVPFVAIGTKNSKTNEQKS